MLILTAVSMVTLIFEFDFNIPTFIRYIGVQLLYRTKGHRGHDVTY